MKGRTYNYEHLLQVANDWFPNLSNAEAIEKTLEVYSDSGNVGWQQKEQEKYDKMTKGTMTVSQVLNSVVGSMSMDKKVEILLAAINDLRTIPYTGVNNGCGKIYGDQTGEVLEWKDFLGRSVVVGNIKI